MPLVHLASRLYGTPLLIAREKLEVILSVLGPRIGLLGAKGALPVPLPTDVARPPPPSGLAVIPIHGTLVRRALGLEAASGLTSYGEIAHQLDAALNDPQVQGIVLDIDSSGGEAGGVFELAERIRAASRVKPIWAHANDTAFSAAYAIAAAAPRLTLSRTAGVGSIGVIALHVDQSAKDAREGLSYTAIIAGHHKNDFSPHAPLSPQAASTLQAEVDRLYDLFVEQVAGMRCLDLERVRATEAGLYFGEAAVAAGLADAVSSLDAVLADFADLLSTPRGPQARASPATPTHNLLTSFPLPLNVEQPMPESEHPSPPEALSRDEPLDPTPIPTDQPTDPTTAPPMGEAPATNAGEPVPVAGQTWGEAQAIAELCLIAGLPQRTCEFLAAGMTQAQVRQVLLEARAAQPDIASHITAEAGTTARPEHSPVVAAVKKLINQE